MRLEFRRYELTRKLDQALNRAARHACWASAVQPADLIAIREIKAELAVLSMVEQRATELEHEGDL
ncbi:MAG: hypothetical protein H0T89_00980 [Deltaproteobacteria bacterium]|nr:hypothetical protein [Deltaproteobacteria bacterium]